MDTCTCVNTRTSTAQRRTPASRPARQYHRPADHAYHREPSVTALVVLIIV